MLDDEHVPRRHLHRHDVTLPIGTPFLVRLQVGESGEHLELNGEVASQDVSADLTREQRGMGIRFVNLSEEQRKQVSELYEHAMKKAIEASSTHRDRSAPGVVNPDPQPG